MSKEKNRIQPLLSECEGKKVKYIFLFFSLLLLLIVVATFIGPANIDFKNTLFTLFSSKSGGLNEWIIWKLRLPRILMAVIAGSCLALAGTTMQGILHNPLASPFTLGVASAAGFGAGLAIILGVGTIGGEYLIVGNAFIFALLAFLIVYGLAGIKKLSPGTIILAGIAMTYFFSALSSLIKYIGGSEAVKALVVWMMGDLIRANWKNVTLCLVVLIISIPFLWRMAWHFNALASGDETAKNLGVKVKQIRIISMLLASLLTAVVVSFTGTIGFIGLVSPHIARMFIGSNHKFLFPASCITGALILLGADIAAKVILAPRIIPVGIVSSFLGIPFFLYLLLKKKERYW